MSWSYRVIKNNLVEHDDNTDFQVPIVVIEDEVEEKNEEQSVETQQRIMEAQQKAKQIVDGAMAEKERLLSETAQLCEDMKKSSYEEGYHSGYEEGKKKGYDEGYRAGFNETEDLRDQQKGVLREAHNRSREYIEKTQEEIIQLAVHMAQSITRFVINKEDVNIVKMVQKALEAVKERKQITLRCHPQNVLFLESNVHEFEKICPNGRVIILGDESLEENGCIVETELQIIDLQITHQLENIKKALLEMGNSHGH